jgi:hypothetical protein
LVDGENGIVPARPRVGGAQARPDRGPCIEVAYLTDAQRRAYIIADNKLALNGRPCPAIRCAAVIRRSGGNRFVRWTDVKYRGMTEHVWAKVHLMCGVKTHIITAAVILDRNASDLAQLPKLLHTTAQNFTVRQVSADAVYNTKRNQEEIAAIGAEAFIPFKRNHTGKQGGLWGEKLRQWREEQD